MDGNEQQSAGQPAPDNAGVAQPTPPDSTGAAPQPPADKPDAAPSPAAEGSSLESIPVAGQSSTAPSGGLSSVPVTTPGAMGGADLPPKPKRSLKDIFSFNKLNIYLVCFILLLVAGVAFVVYDVTRTSKNKAPTITSQNLTEQQLQQIANGDVNVGNSNEVLNIAANSVFGGQVLIRKDLNVAGGLQVGGSLSLPSLQVANTGKFGQIQASTASISGNTAVQGGLTVAQGLTVNGDGNFGGSLTASKLNITTLTLNGDLVIDHHVQAGGSTPGRSTGSALGNGGTASVSGSDTAGTVNINTGSSAAAGCFITLTFVQAFSSTPHVVVTPIGSSAGGLNFYVNRSTTSMSICSASTPPSGSSFAFDYIVFD